MDVRRENQLVVGIGEYQVSGDVHAVLKTYALGSCVAILAYDSAQCVAGMMHVALPDAAVDSAKAVTHPGHFADTGVPLLLAELYRAGAQRRSTVFKLIGGSNVMDPMNLFDIGRRNVLAIRKQLWKENLAVGAEDVGGGGSRSVTLAVADGAVGISSADRKWTL